MWFFDGSVNCYSGSHLGLTIMAVLFMLVGVLLIAPVAVIAYQKEISKKVCVCVCVCMCACVCVHVCVCVCVQGHRNGGAVAPLHNYWVGLAPLLHCIYIYRYSDKYHFMCHILFIQQQVATFESCLYLIPRWRRECIQRRVFH